MRGKEHTVFALNHFEGITPAYAGKSARKTPESVIIQDHPRVCGEKTKKIP